MTILGKKAGENYRTAVYAEKNKMFNVAISRYYYCALLSSKDYLVNKMGIPEQELKPANGRVSEHTMIISRLINTLSNDTEKNYWEYGRIIKRFNEFKDVRNEYEYGTNSDCGENIYRKDYEKMIKGFLDALKSLNVLTIRR